MAINATDKQIESNNLKVIKDQLGYESLLNKKFSQYATQCTDTNLKDLCNQASGIHKQSFNELKAYLDSHQ
jgi:hypothetical protein